MSYILEINNERKDENYARRQIRQNSVVNEVFSAMVNGKDVAPVGKKEEVAAATKWIKEQSSKASNGDPVATAELNAVRRMVIEPVLMQEIKLLSIFGSYTPLAWGDSCEVEVTDFANIQANIQAPNQDVPFPVIRKKRVPVPTVTVSGGYAVDYRKVALGDMSKENELQEQVRVQIRNKAAKYIIETVYTAITDATGVKYFFEGAGMTKTGVDDVLTKVRRFGKPTVVGDYALISQFNGFAGYTGVTPTVNGISEAIMNEIHQTGLMGMYNGAILSEIPNAYDLTTLNANGDNFETILPQGLGFVIPTGGQSPVHSVTRGGLTSMTGNDVTSGTEISRFDLEIGTILEPNGAYKIATLHDENLDDLSK